MQGIRMRELADIGARRIESVDRCPRHNILMMLMKCTRCSRRVWEHLNAIERKFGQGAPKRGQPAAGA